MDYGDKIDKDSEEVIIENEEFLNEELWDAGIILLKNNFENTIIR